MEQDNIKVAFKDNKSIILFHILRAFYHDRSFNKNF